MSSERFNIVKLIEKNSITRLSKEYESKLVNKIKNTFTNSDHQIFLANFYCYLKYNCSNEFVIDFDNVWKWIGFSRKDHAKTLLEKNFSKDTDYKIFSYQKDEVVGKTIFHSLVENSFRENDSDFTFDKTAPLVGGAVLSTSYANFTEDDEDFNQGKSAPATSGADFPGHITDDIIEDLTLTEEYKKLDKLNKKTLIDLCKSKGIKSSGTKDEIIKRIILFEKESKKSVKGMGGAGLNKEKIMLTINTFKKFCLKSNTQKADEIHDYYIKLETVLQETINEQTNELRLQLMNKEEEKNKLEEENKKLTRKYIKKEKEIFEDKNVVYLMTTDEAEKKGEYAVGKALDLTNRKGNYDHNKLHDFKVIYYVSCKGPRIMDCLESLILSKLGKHRCKAGRDIFCVPDGKDTSLFTNMFDTCFKMYDDVEDDDIKYPIPTKPHLIKDRKEYKKQYYENNIERMKENQKKFYQNNKHIMSLLKHIYCKENEDKIREKNKKYYEEHKDEIIKVNMDYYYTNKDDILGKRKEFYQNNKDVILEERDKYYKENYKTKIAPQRQELVDCECGITVTNYCMNKHKNTKMHIERMENINKPVTSALKQRVKCECGMVIAQSGVKRHINTERHSTLMGRLCNDNF